MRSCNITFIQSLIAYLNNSKRLEQVNFSRCGFNDESIKHLVTGLQHSSLSELSLSNNKLESKSLETLTLYLSKVTLESLDISYNKFTNDSRISGFFKMLESNFYLSKLNVSGMELGEKGGEYLVTFIGVTSTLKDLNVSNTKISGKTFFKIGRLLRQHPSIIRIDLSLNSIQKGLSREEMDDALAFLSKSEILTELDISDNNFNSEFGNLLAKHLSNNKCLSTLNIAGNWLENTLLSPIWFEGLEKSSLKVLDITNCKMSKEGIRSILSSISKNSSFAELFIGGNTIDQSMPGLADFLSNSSVMLLDMRMMGITDDGVAVIAQSVKGSTNLKILNLEQNNITDIGVMIVIGTIRSTSALRKISFSKNPIPNQSKMDIFEQFSQLTNVSHMTM